MSEEDYVTTVGGAAIDQDPEQEIEEKPETTEAAEAEAEKEIPEEPALEEDEEEKEAKKEHKRVQRRIDRLTKEKYELKAELEAARRYQQAQEPSDDEAELDLAQIIEQAVIERENAKAAEQFTKKSESLLEKAATLGDFDIEDFIPLPRGAADAVVEIDKPEIVVYLQDNPELIDKLSEMTPYMQAVEIGKLDAKLSAPKPVKKSQAPEPIKPVGGGKSPPLGDLSELSTEDYIRERNKQVRG